MSSVRFPLAGVYQQFMNTLYHQLSTGWTVPSGAVGAQEMRSHQQMRNLTINFNYSPWEAKKFERVPKKTFYFIFLCVFGFYRFKVNAFILIVSDLFGCSKFPNRFGHSFIGIRALRKRHMHSRSFWYSRFLGGDFQKLFSGR